MDEQEFRALNERIHEGLLLAHKQMLREKALHDECIVVYSPEQDAIVHIPAREVLDRHPEWRL